MRLHPKALMRSSSLVMFCLGAAATFAPQELPLYSGTAPQPLTVLIVQAAGALYFGFAILNWMAQDNLIGGIYSRPVALGNLVQFILLAAALLRLAGGGHRELVLLILASIYVIFAVWFGLITFTHPKLHQEVAQEL